MITCESKLTVTLMWTLALALALPWDVGMGMGVDIALSLTLGNFAISTGVWRWYGSGPRHEVQSSTMQTTNVQDI